MRVQTRRQTDRQTYGRRDGGSDRQRDMLIRTRALKETKGDSIELCPVTLRYAALRSERRAAAAVLAAARGFCCCEIAAVDLRAALPVTVGDY